MSNEELILPLGGSHVCLFEIHMYIYFNLFPFCMILRKTGTYVKCH